MHSDDYMKQETCSVRINGSLCTLTVLKYEDSDRDRIKRLYNSWRELSVGMREFKSRGVNLPEGISESAFCLEYGCARALEVQGETSASFDTIDLRTGRRQQIKACSVEDDLTSFGPKSVWDDLYFLDFYKDGNYDGSFDVYKIPNNLLLNFPMNKTQTFKHQQRQGRRPRLHLKAQIIEPNRIKPDRTCKI